MTQQTWGAPPQQQFPQQGQPQFPAQPAPGGYAPQQNPWGGQPQPQQVPAQPVQQSVRVEVGDEFDDFFSGGGTKIPGFDFGATQNGGEKMIGAMIQGTIVEMAKMQQRDYTTGDPLFWEPRTPGEAREPRMQVAITLQTELRNWQGVKPKNVPKDASTEQPLPPEADDGKRRVYAKGDLQRAINVACDKAGQKPRKGGKLAVRVRGFEPSNRGNDKVLYDAQYLPAPEVVPTDSFFEQPAQQAPPQQQFQPTAVAPQGGQVYMAPPGTQLPPPAQQAPQGFDPSQLSAPPAPQPPAQVAGYAIQPQGQQNPSTLGNGQAPTQAPDWAQPQGQGYAPQGEAPQQAPSAPVPSSQYAEPQF